MKSPISLVNLPTNTPAKYSKSLDELLDMLLSSNSSPIKLSKKQLENNVMMFN